MLILTGIFLALLAVCLVILLAGWWRRGRVKPALILAFVIILSSGLLYALLGSPRIIEPLMSYERNKQVMEQQVATYSMLVSSEPENIEAWLYLAQAHQDLGQYHQAAEGFRQAVLLSKGNPRIVMAYAEALILQDEGVVNEQARKSIEVALMIDPQLPIARYYHAIWLLQENRHQEAMQKMKSLYQDLPEDSQLRRVMDKQIGKE